MLLKIGPAAIASIIAICVVLAMGSLYAYLSFNARRIFNAQISSLTKCHVEARVVRAEFPATLVVEGLNIDGLMTCEQLRASVDVKSLLKRNIRIHTLELTHPVLIWENTAAIPEPVAAKGVPAEAPAAKVVSDRNVILAQLLIHDGTVKVVARNNAGRVRNYIVNSVQMRARNVPLTDTPARTEFFLTASLLQLNVPFVGHFLKASGSLNWAAKDMDATAQVTDDSGKVGLDAKLSSRKNDMSVSGNVVLAGGQEAQATGNKAGVVENAMLDLMLSTNTDVDLDFSFKTKMDHVELGAVNFSGHITTGLNSSATSGNIVVGLKAAGEELLKAPDNTGAQK